MSNGTGTTLSVALSSGVGSRFTLETVRLGVKDCVVRSRGTVSAGSSTWEMRCLIQQIHKFANV